MLASYGGQTLEPLRDEDCWFFAFFANATAAIPANGVMLSQVVQDAFVGWNNKRSLCGSFWTMQK